jgi:uncharacterized membrane protein
MAVAFAVRMYRLGDENFWVDEVYQHRVASLPLPEIARNYHPGATFGETDQAPLSMMISHFFVTDRSAEYWARIPSAAFGTLNVLALFLVSSQLLPYPLSLLASLFLAVSPLGVWYSQEARWYALWGFGTTVSYLALLRAEKTGSPAPWIAYWFTTVVNLYTFIYAVFVIVAQSLSLVWRQRTERGSARPLVVFSVVTLAALVFAAPVVAMIVGSVDAGKVYSGTPRSSSLLELPYTFLCFCTGFTVGPTLADLHDSPRPWQILRENPELALVSALFIAITLLGIRRTLVAPRLAVWLAPWLITVPALVFLTAALLPEMTYQVRYTFASLPAFSLLLAIGVFALDRRRHRWIAAGAVVTVSLYSLSNLYWAERYDKADVRGAVAYMTSMTGDSREVVVVGQIRDVMPFYADRIRDLGIIFCGTGEYEGYRLIDVSCVGENCLPGTIDTNRGLWLVAGRDWAQEHRRCLQLLSYHFVTEEHTKFTGVKLWRLEPRADGS